MPPRASAPSRRQQSFAPDVPRGARAAARAALVAAAPAPDAAVPDRTCRSRGRGAPGGCNCRQCGERQSEVLMARDGRKSRYRAPTGRLPVSVRRVARVRILGPLEVLERRRSRRARRAEAACRAGDPAPRANRVVSVERLADDLYAGAPPVTAVTQVQRQVSELRKLLGASAIETRSPGYLLHVERRAARPRPLRALDARGRAGARARRRRGGRAPARSARSRSGAARRSPTWRTSRSRRPRSLGWRSCAWRRSSSASTPSSSSAAMRARCRSSRRWSGTTRFASGCRAS